MVATMDIPKTWHKILMAIPGYDPFLNSEGYYFDLDAAREAVNFFPRYLRHIKGPKAGQPFKLAKWEKSIIANLFGWKNEIDGMRRYREAFIFVPRKNGKTSLAAGVVIYVLTCDGEAGAEIYSAANDKEQAALVFNTVKGMVAANPELEQYCRVYKNSVTLFNPDLQIETNSFYKPISADAYTKHGYNSHLVIDDELHAQKDRELIDVLETSTGARAQPLFIHITTSDYERPSICNEKYDYAVRVRDGYPDPEFLPVIYEAKPDDDWMKPSIWRKANPNLGVSLSRKYFLGKFKKAKESPAFLNTFLRLHLNIKTEQEIRWVEMDKWDACAFAVNEDELIGKECFVGFDLSSNRDITARVMLFPPDKDCNLWRILPRFYVPKDNAIKREERENVLYFKWGTEGYIKLTPGNVVDYSIVKADFESDYERFNMIEVAFDRWNFEALRQQFIADGVDEEKFVSFGQGFASMSAPCKELERLMLSQLLAHGGNPVLRWMAQNVTIEIDAAGNIKPSKKKSSEKIDGIVALLMALGRALVAEQKKRESVYEKHGLRYV